MFKTPFSFDGRIRRTEYGLSILINAALSVLASGLTGLIAGSDREAVGVLYLFFMLPLIWFGLAQGVKRSHDIGNSGWYVLIPFYGLWLLFAEGDAGNNKYGANPKATSLNAVNSSLPTQPQRNNTNNQVGTGYQGGYDGGHNGHGNHQNQTSIQNSSGSNVLGEYRSGDMYK